MGQYGAPFHLIWIKWPIDPGHYNAATTCNRAFMPRSPEIQIGKLLDQCRVSRFKCDEVAGFDDRYK